MAHDLQYPDAMREEISRSRQAMGRLWGAGAAQGAPILERTIRTRGMTHDAGPDAVSEICDWRAAWRRAATDCGAELVETRKNFALARDLAFLRKLVISGRAQLAAFLGGDHPERLSVFDKVIARMEWLKGAPVTDDGLRALLYRSEAAHLDTLVSLLHWRCGQGWEDLRDISLRELPVHGMSTKWIERHRGLVLAAFRDFGWLRDEAESLEGKLGLFEISKAMVKIRIHGSSCGGGWVERMDIQPALFTAPPPRISRVVIVENETTLMRYDPGPGDCYIFGQGKAILAYARMMPWLMNYPILYWGDCDGHGFDILDQLRGQLPQTRSFMMDWEGTSGYLDMVVPEDSKARVTHAMTRLTEGESRLRDWLSAQHLFLEQERLPRQALRELLAESDVDIRH